MSTSDAPITGTRPASARSSARPVRQPCDAVVSSSDQAPAERSASRPDAPTSAAALPEGFKGACTSAEVAVHPSGKFLYGSNRGDHNSIAVFSIDPKSGKLASVQHQPTGGKVPRGFGIDPTGRFLLAANQDSDNVVVYRVDPSTGQVVPGKYPTVP